MEGHVVSGARVRIAVIQSSTPRRDDPAAGSLDAEVGINESESDVGVFEGFRRPRTRGSTGSEREGCELLDGPVLGGAGIAFGGDSKGEGYEWQKMTNLHD